MTLLPALAALALAAATLVSGYALASGRSRLGTLVRSLSGAAAVALVPSLAEPGARPWAVLGIASAVVPRPLATLVGAAGALALAFGAAVGDLAPLAQAVAGVAAVAAAAAAWDAAEARLAAGADSAWAAAAGGGLLALVLAAVGGRRLLAWGFALDARLAVREAGVLLALGLLTALAGTLVLGAHLGAGSAIGLARLIGQRLLLLAAGFTLLGLGFAVGRGHAQPEVLASGAPRMAACAGALGVLVLGLMLLLGERRAGPVDSLESRGVGETRVALVVALLAAVAAAGEGYWRQGSYATATFGATTAAALLGLATIEATRFELLRRVLFLAGLLSVLG